MKKYIILTLFIVCTSCFGQNTTKDVMLDSIRITYENELKRSEVPIVDSKKNGSEVYFNETGDFDGFRSFETDVQKGLSLYMKKNTAYVKNIADNEDKDSQNIVISFQKKGTIYIKKKVNDSIFQIMNLNLEGKIKDFGYIINASPHGWFYKFDEQGKLIKKVLYKEGNIIKEVIHE